MAVVVLHSTEGGSLDGAVATLRRNNTMSHEVVDVRGREVVQLVDYASSARSLLNLPGGVETNRRGGVVQVEIVGFAARSTAEAKGLPGAPVIPELTDDELRWFGVHLRWLCARVGAPFTFPCPFVPYPQSYGANGVRLSLEAWLRVEGVIGHMHVPENAHGDPGALDVARLVALSAPAPAQLTPDLEVLLMSTTAFQLVGTDGHVRLFVPGQRSVSLGGLPGPHERLAHSDAAPLLTPAIPSHELDEFARRWDASVG